MGAVGAADPRGVAGWIVKRSDERKGFVVLPRRRVVERTLSWFGDGEGTFAGSRSNDRVAP